MDKRKILLITSVFLPEPVVSANLMYDLACELSKNHEVCVICPPATRPMGFKMEKRNFGTNKFKLLEVPSFTYPQSKLYGRFKESYSLGHQIRKYIKHHHEEFDLILNGAWPLAGQFVIAKTAKKYKIPYISTVQDIYPESITSHINNKLVSNLALKLLFPIDKYILKNAVKIHTISDKMVEYLSKTRDIDQNKFFFVKNWQDEKIFIDFNDLNNKKNHSNFFTFMYMGNVGPLAGLELVINSFSKANLSNARLIIAGDGSVKQSLKEYVKQNQIRNIEFWDVPSGQVPMIQSHADVMLLPIKKGYSATSIPSKLPAYMFSKKPILACVDKESDTARSIELSGSGWIVEPENCEKLTEAMIKAVNSDNILLQEMGQKGYDFSIKYFSKSENLKKYITEINKLFQ